MKHGEVQLVRVKICGITTEQEAELAVRAGANAVGFLLALVEGPHGPLTPDAARAIVRRLPPFVTAVLVTTCPDWTKVASLASHIAAQAVQLHADLTPQDIQSLYSRLPATKLIKAIHVSDPDPVEQARFWAPLLSALVLDSRHPATRRPGGTGLVHDWALSRAIVDSVPCPVILAGGLRPDNVAEAVRTVRPWAVDVHSGVENADGTRSYERMAEFVRQARQALG